MLSRTASPLPLITILPILKCRTYRGREGGREPSLHWVVTNLSLCIKWKYFWSTVKPLSQTTVTKKLRVLCGFLELRLRQSRLISSSLHLLLRSFLLMDWTGLEWLDWSGLARKVSRPAMASGAVEGSVLFVSQMVMNYQVKKRLNCLNASVWWSLNQCRD